MNSIFEVLEAFILQAHAGDLKTSTYPKEWNHLQMKVSFGQGVLARVPWIALYAPEMQVSQGFYPVYLFFRAANRLVLSYGVSETAEYQSSWPSEVTSHKPKINEYFSDDVPRYGDSFVFKVYEPTIDEGVVSFLADDSDQVIMAEAMNRDLEELTNYYKTVVSAEVRDEESEISQSLLYMEKQLEDFIIHNWEQTELAEGYELIYEEGELISQQYQTDIGRIDILARDKATQSHVVIELKKNQTSDDTVGQLARYMGWIKKKFNDNDVKGIIIAGRFDEKLEYAIGMVPRTEVFLYKVDFTLQSHS